ncbi:MAG: hypothetical protein LBJ00_05010 [Planctomycetaceae bacterium]|nr:hypothetical protein [Planctomycetaceae bacterium]
MELNTQSQQREAVVQGRNLSPHRLRYTAIASREVLRIYGKALHKNK